MLNDFRTGLRSLAKSPGFSLAAIGALALGIGANTTIFSALNALLINPAGIDDPARVVAVRAKYEKLNLASIPLSLPDFDDIRKARNLFSAAAVQSGADFSYVSNGIAQRLVASRVTHRWFEVFGVKPLHGRLFHEEEDRPKANYVIVLSYAGWQRFFGGEVTAIGRKIRLNTDTYEVIGVMPPEFREPLNADFWMPAGIAAEQFGPQNRFNESYFVMARLQPRMPIDQANAAVKVLAFQNLNPNQRKFAADSQWGMFLDSFSDFTLGPQKSALSVLMAAVAMVLLIACANVAGLMLARATDKSREIALRAALGAGVWRLVRLSLAEGLLLAFAGSAAGLLLSIAGMRLLVSLAPAELYAERLLKLDASVLAFTAAAAVLAALIFGVAPAWWISRLSRYEILKEGGRGGSSGVARQRTRSALVVAEVALALILLVCAGLFLRSFANIQRISPGFDPKGLMSFQLRLVPRTGEDPKAAEQRWTMFHRTLVEKLNALPGVRSAAAAVGLPFTGGDNTGSFAIPGRDLPPGDPGPHGRIRQVSPGYFGTMGVPVLRGRDFNDGDRADAENVVLIDENLARQYWSNQDPIGKTVQWNRVTQRIVGVVGNIKQTDLAADTNKGIIYLPLYQRPMFFGSYVLRTNGDPRALAMPIRLAVQQLDPNQPIYGLETMGDRINLVLSARRFIIGLLAVFAVMALALAALGLYGVISYSVAQRTQEIGIRMALGSPAGRVLSLVISQGMRLALLGVAIGFLAAFGLARILATQLFNVSPFDAATFAGVTAILLLVACAASYLPARRAAKVDPLVALRHE